MANDLFCAAEEYGRLLTGDLRLAAPKRYVDEGGFLALLPRFVRPLTIDG